MLYKGVFLHDYRIKAEGMKVRTTRQNKANATNKDTFYWPDMTVSMTENDSTVIAFNYLLMFLFFI